MPTRPALVLLHGWGFSPAVWQPLVESLTDRFDCVTPALPGFGTQAGDLASLDSAVDALLVDAPPSAIWVGWSLGGLLAARVALRAPERVCSLITIACNPCFITQSGWPGMAVDTFASFQQGLATSHEKTLGRFLLLNTQGDPAARLRTRSLKKLLATDTDPMVLAQGLQRLAEDQRKTFADITLPQCHLYGYDDVLVPVGIAQTPLLAGYSQVIQGAGHTLFLSHPEAVVKALDHLHSEEGKGD